MSVMNLRAMMGRGRDWLARIRIDDTSRPFSGETFSLLALRLERDLKRGDKGRSILITAADDDSVGIEATVELAWCLAESLGHSVLVVDGTFDTQALSTVFGLSETTGLTDVLRTPDSAGVTLNSVVQPTLHERIGILPHGKEAGVNVTRVEAIEQLLAVACGQFDFVLVHGSILTESSRSLAFSSLVDAALLIAVEDITTMDQVRRGHRLLNDCGVSRVALVLANRPRTRRPNGR